MGKGKKKAKKQRGDYAELYLDQDDCFYFIAGYTSGGAPYGITWEEARRDGLIDEENDDGDFES